MLTVKCHRLLLGNPFFASNAHADVTCEQGFIHTKSGFPTLHKVGNVNIFVLCKYQDMPDTDVGQMNLYLMHHDKCKSAF